MSCRDGASRASIADPPAQLGMPLEQQPERPEAAHDVLRRIGPVDTQRRAARAATPRSPARARARPPRPASRSNSSVSMPIGCAVTRVDRPACSTVQRPPSTSAPSRSAHEPRKLRRQRVVWKPTTSFASSPSCIARRSGPGSTCPVVGLRPGDMDEVRRDDVGPPGPNDRGRKVEVIVVEEDRRVRLPLELVERRRRECLVDRHVAVRPGGVDRGVEVGRAAEPPEVVLEEPQRRVREHVVEAVVRRRVVGDEGAAGSRRPRASSRRSATPSAATALSSSLIALAIQVTS